MEQNKTTDESVKTGLHVEGNTKPDTATETANEINKELDGDEAVHESSDDIPDEIAGHDPDELVHLQKDLPINTNEEIDVDDLLHEKDAGEEEH